MENTNQVVGAVCQQTLTNFLSKHTVPEDWVGDFENQINLAVLEVLRRDPDASKAELLQVATDAIERVREINGPLPADVICGLTGPRCTTVTEEGPWTAVLDGVREELQCQSPDVWDILVMHLLEGLNVHQVAAELCFSEEKARKELDHAVELLAHIVAAPR